MLVKMGSNWNTHTLLVEMYNGTADVKIIKICMCIKDKIHVINHLK